MTEDDVVSFVRAYIEGLFPRFCPNCGLRFGSLREYLLLTKHLGSPIFYDSIDGEIPSEPVGPLSLANCACGTTLTVNSRGIPPTQMVELFSWAKLEMEKRSIDGRELLRHIRDRIDSQVLSEYQDEDL